MIRRNVSAGFMLVGFCLAMALVSAQGRITSPKQQFGFTIGDDYQLATYTQFVEYWQKLDKESDRLKVIEIGKTAEGRPQLMAIITSPENHKKLDRYKEISRRLAHAEGLTDEQARALAREGRAVVWFDGGLHATEVLGAHQLMETVYQLVSLNDAETLRFLQDLVILAVHANPDGMELVSNWYMREKEPTRRSSGGLPRLYQKYIGHDNNRDFYLSSQAETTNMNRVMYHEWFPQIMYNHHQTGPAGTVMFAPPFRDPFNYVYDPLIPAQLDLVGAAMHSRFAAEGKPGVTTRRGANYSTWFNGGLRTTTYFHNMIGLLTETIGNPTPIEIPFIPDRQLASSNLFYPIAPQKWHFRQSVDYSVTANRAVFDIASRNRENFLYNIYRMGMNSIERGNRDYWTMYPGRIDQVKASIAARSAEGQAADRAQAGRGGGGGGGRGGGAPVQFFEQLRKPEWRDARGYILPSDQSDFLTATKFVNALIKTGVTVHRATAPFTVGQKKYPAGSYVVKSAQSFRPHVLDMFEPQDHPNDLAYPGGPPIAPYDNAGWTLAFQMGVKFDRILEGFDGPFEKIPGLLNPPAGKVADGSSGAGFVLGHETNDAFRAVNRLIAAGEEVHWLLQDRIGGKTGSYFIPTKATTRAVLEKLASEIGVSFEAAATRPTGESLKLRKMRVGLVDRYGGSMPSGWTRWIFEQFELPFEVVYPPMLDAGNLASRFDVLIFPSDLGGGGGRGGGGGGGGTDPETQPEGGRGAGAGQDPQRIPAEYRNQLGAVTAQTTVPQIKRFIEEGGTVLLVGGSTRLATGLGVPVTNPLVERGPDGQTRPLGREKFYVPGSVVRIRVDISNPIAHGITDPVDAFYDNSPVFAFEPDAQLKGVTPVAWFDGPTPLRSGWAWGQGYLDGTLAIVQARMGKGRVFLFGPEITFRAQPHGTFKFLFNGIYLAASAPGGRPTTEAQAGNR